MYKHVERLFFSTLACRVVFFFFKILRQESLMPFNNIVDLLFSQNQYIDNSKHNRKEIMKLYLFFLSPSYAILRERKAFFLLYFLFCGGGRLSRERTAFTIDRQKARSVFKKASTRSAAFLTNSGEKKTPKSF
jgi:hypothetical protein